MLLMSVNLASDVDEYDKKDLAFAQKHSLWASSQNANFIQPQEHSFHVSERVSENEVVNIQTVFVIFEISAPGVFF